MTREKKIIHIYIIRFCYAMGKGLIHWVRRLISVMEIKIRCQRK